MGRASANAVIVLKPRMRTVSKSTDRRSVMRQPPTYQVSLCPSRLGSLRRRSWLLEHDVNHAIAQSAAHSDDHNERCQKRLAVRAFHNMTREPKLSLVT